jgi:hypothetical protein
VAPQAFTGLGGANSLEALRDARIAGGMTATIETLEYIQVNFDGLRPNGGSDDATRVRQFLTAAHNEWGTQYALLIGDADAGDVGGESGDLLMPVRGIWLDGGQEMRDYLPADQYYSCLDGSYDESADGQYGEPWDGPNNGEVDLLAELYVGRAPADSAEEVQNFVAKTLAYENGAGTWLKDVLMLGEWLFDGPVWGGDFMDGIIHGSSSGGYTTLGYDSFPFFECQTLYDRDAGQADSWEAGDVMPLLNNGPHIVNHLGHSATYWNMRMTTAQADSLFNTRPFFHYSQGCYNGSFDNNMASESGGQVSAQDCFAEHLLLGEHGAFATASNSRYGLGSYGTDGPSNRFHRQFWDAFFAEGATTIGEAFADCKDDNASAYSDLGNRWAGFTINLLGDPAVALKKSINTTDPLLGIYPPSFRFFAKLGDPAPEPAELFVRNDGVGQLSFTAAADQPWISLSPDSGSAPQDLQIQVEPAGLGADTHAGVITVTSPEAPNSPAQLDVELTVIDVPEIRLPHVDNAPSLNGRISSGEYDGALALPIDMEETGDVTLYLAVSGNRLYIAVDDLTDITDGYDDFLLFFDRDLDGQWPTSPGTDGVYRAMGRWVMFINIYNPGGGYEVGNYQQNPAGFRVEMGMQDGHRVYEAYLDLISSRLDIGPYEAFGMYLQIRNTIEWSIYDVTGIWPRWVPELDDQRFFGKVDMAPDGPRLDSTPLSLLYNAVEGQGPPASQNLSIFDREGGSIAFTATTSDSWLLVSPGSGQTPGDITVSIDHSQLLPGDHQGFVIIEAATWNSPFEIPVTLRVWAPAPRLVVDPASLHVTAAAGGPDPSVDLTVANAGGQPMDFVITASETWLRMDPREGAVGPYSSQVVDVSAVLSEIGQGTHSGNLTVRGIMAEDGLQTVPVQVDVVAPRPVPPVEDFDLGVLDQSLQLNWTCPDDPLVTGVLVRKGVGVPPAGPQLGELIYQGMEETFTDEGLVNGTSYCYSAFAYDAAGRYSEPTGDCAVPGPNRKPPMPELLSPANAAAVPATPELVASTVADPDGDVVAYTFVLQGLSGDTLDSAVVEGSGNRVGWLPNTQLEPETTYRWQVEAVDSQGAHSGFAETRSFVIHPPTDAGSPDGGDGGGGDPDCGCGHTGSAAPSLLLLVFGLLLLGRRRF